MKLGFVLLKNFSNTILIVWLTMSIVFFAVRLLPGDIVTGQFAGSGVSEMTQNRLREELGLNKPVLQQYLDYFSEWIQGNWGIAISTGELVSHAITRSLSITLTIVIISMVISTALGMFWASMIIYSPYQWLRYFLKMLLDLFLAIPIYWSATLVLFIWTIPINSQINSIGVAVLLLVVHLGASVTQVIHGAIRREFQAGYVQTAVSKGLPLNYIYLWHILPNIALIYVPFITSQASLLIGGTVIIESILLLPGIGTLLLNATLNRDYLLLQGVITVTVILVALINSLGEILLLMINPRLRTNL